MLLARLLLAAVFAVAGLAKLADRAGTRKAVADFGAPERLAAPLAIALPVAEVAVAALLLPAATAVWAALGALLLLVVFSAAIAVALAHGRAPDCHCFGQLHSEPAGRRAILRNAVLAGIAVSIVVAGQGDPGPGAFGWLAELDGLQWLVLALGAAVVLVTVAAGLVVLHLMRSYGRVLTRLDRAEERLQAAGLDLDEPDEIPPLGLTPGTSAPAFSLAALDGERVSLDDLRADGLPLLLVFTSPTCGQCSVLMPKVAEWQREHANEVTVALLSGGKPSLVREQTTGLEHVLLDKDLSVYEAYDVNGTPSAVLVADDGAIAAWTAGGEWIETLFEQALGGLGSTPGLPIGAEAPLEIAGLVRGPTAVLFWNPDCGFCQSMEDDLRAWLADPPAGAPALVVVSSGEFGLEAPVVDDPDWTLAGTLGADGTPMAVQIDHEARVASAPVAGATAVFELLGAREHAVAG